MCTLEPYRRFTDGKHSFSASSGESKTESSRDRMSSRAHRNVASLTLVLYLTLILLDAIRKMAHLSNAGLVLVFILTIGLYIFLFPKMFYRKARLPMHLPLFMILLSIWCLAEALVMNIPVEVALDGWASYVFFVPLFYVGAELLFNDVWCQRALKTASVAGALIGLGAIASALLGRSAPPFLRPITSTVGLHSSAGGNIYLAPSIFATAEQAAEHLLVALFCLAALIFSSRGFRRRSSSAIIGVLICGGLIATERRADIYVALAGLFILAIGRHMSNRDLADKPFVRAIDKSRRSVAAVICLTAVGSAAIVPFIGAGKMVSFLTSGSAEARISLMFSSSNPSSLTGQGPGTSTQGISILGATSLTEYTNNGSYSAQIVNGRTFRAAEGGLAKTWLELGLIGALIYGGLFWTALAAPVRQLFRLDDVGRSLTVLALALGLIFLKGHQSLDDVLVQPVYWLVVGGIWSRMQNSDYAGAR